MKHTRRFINSLQDQCSGIPDEELLELANNIDNSVGNLLLYSFKHCASYEQIECTEARHGRAVPISRNVFYIKRRRYIDSIEQHLADTLASV